jgi:Cys-tRNA(Pro) deacylase
MSETPATQFLRRHQAVFTEHPYDYVAHGGALESARQLNASPPEVVKTLIMQDELAKPLVILMHGDQQVSTKTLARALSCKSVAPCLPEVAQRHSGYLVGGTSPFGLKKPMRIFVEQTILNLPLIYINGGRRGYLIRINPAILSTLLAAVSVNCALPK